MILSIKAVYKPHFKKTFACILWRAKPMNLEMKPEQIQIQSKAMKSI